MPSANTAIQFKYGLQANFELLEAKEANTVYFCTDSQRLFVGDVEYTRPVQVGAEDPDTFLPPMSFFYNTATKELKYSQTGDPAQWVTCSNFYTHPSFAAKVLGNQTSATLAFSGTFKVPKITIDDEGHVSAGEDITLTLPAAPSEASVSVKKEGTGPVVASVVKDETSATGITVTNTTLADAGIASETDLTAAEGRITALEGKPAAGITAEDITAWNNEKGAKAAASAAQATADAAVVANEAITAGTHTKITYDAKGLVTDGADLTAADIPTLTLSKISDAGTAAAKNVATQAIGTAATEDLVTGNQVKTYVEGAIAGLSGAMHYVGESTTDPSTGTATVEDHDEWVAGDVVTYNAKEYVYDGENWRELGDESSFAVKGSIVNSDIAANAAIDQSKVASTMSKASLAEDISDLNTRLTAEEGKADKDTTYTFANGADGSFTVTPLSGEAQKVSIGKPATAGTADEATHAASADSATTAAGADKLNTARTITVAGDATGTASFDGSANVTLTVDVTAADVANKVSQVLTINGQSYDGSAAVNIDTTLKWGTF